MGDTSDGLNMNIEDNLDDIILKEEDNSDRLLNSPSIEEPSIILSDETSETLNVSHYIIPQDVSVTGFEEAADDVGSLASTWDSFTSNSSGRSLVQNSNTGDETNEANTNVFLAFVDDTVYTLNPVPMAIVAPVSEQENGEVVVQKLYEMKDDIFIPNSEEQELNETEKHSNKTKSIKAQMIKLILKDASEILDKDFELKENKLFNEDEFLMLETSRKSDNKEEYVNADIKKLGEPEKLLMYHCTECNTNFTSHTNFKSHMEEHLTKLQNSCALCGSEFNSKSELQNHIKSHFSKPSIITCEICQKEFMTKTVLKRHKKQVHGNNSLPVSLSYKCEVCDSVFSSKFSLKSHTSTHNTRKPYTCQECGATFTQNGSLQVHIRRHRGEKPFKCHICGNTFTRAHSLKVHMKTHTGEKPYSCEYCGACFVTSSHLTVHRRTHTGERPYSCNCCGATFITTSHLNVHRRLHTANDVNSVVHKASAAKSHSRISTCSFCGATFDDIGKLRRHRRMEHRGIERIDGVSKFNEKIGQLCIKTQNLINGCS